MEEKIKARRKMSEEGIVLTDEENLVSITFRGCALDRLIKLALQDGMKVLISIESPEEEEADGAA